MARLDFPGTHQPNFDWLILYCLGSAGQAASHNYYRLIELFKNISFVDIGITMATQKWRHCFWKIAFFSVSRPKLLKRLNVLYSLLLIFKTAKFEKILWERFREKRLWIFCNKNFKSQPTFCQFDDISSFLTHVSRVFAILHSFLIEHLSLKVSSCLLQLISN